MQPNAYVGELQDFNGHPIYAHTESDVVWLRDGSSLKQFLLEESDETIDTMINTILSN